MESQVVMGVIMWVTFTVCDCALICFLYVYVRVVLGVPQGLVPVFLCFVFCSLWVPQLH